MIEDFSSGYYWTTMSVQEYEQGPAIERGLYDFINRELYLDTSTPVVMQIGLDNATPFDVHAESAIPRDVLAMPEGMFESRGEVDVFVLKPEHADRMSDYYG